MNIALLSDTHGHLDPRLPELFHGVDHILHAGDIGQSAIITALEKIAPVTAVLGNNDAGLSFRETETLLLAGRKFLLHHIVEPTRPTAHLRDLLIREHPDLVIFGHTHKPSDQTHAAIRYLNPGYSGRPRFNLPRTVARLTCTPSSVTVAFLPL